MVGSAHPTKTTVLSNIDVTKYIFFCFFRVFCVIRGLKVLNFLTVCYASMLRTQQILKNQHQSLIAEECLANIKVDRTFALVGSTKSKI